MYKFNKYSNQKVVIDNIKFDSKKEANRYLELKIIEKAREISNLQLQKSFLLIDKQKDERAVTYKADFVYYDDKKQRWIAEDVKGYKTKEYIIKRKLFKSIYGKDYDFIEV
jgi:gp72 family protein